MPVKELTCKAHIVALVPDHANPGAFFFRTDNDAYQYDDLTP